MIYDHQDIPQHVPTWKILTALAVFAVILIFIGCLGFMAAQPGEALHEEETYYPHDLPYSRIGNTNYVITFKGDTAQIQKREVFIYHVMSREEKDRAFDLK